MLGINRLERTWSTRIGAVAVFSCWLCVTTTTAQSIVWSQPSLCDVVGSGKDDLSPSSPQWCSFGDPYLFTLANNLTAVAVFVSLQSSNSTSFVAAMNAVTGSVLWKYSPSLTFPVPPYSGWCDGYGDGSGITSTLVCGLDDGVAAINASTGAQLWRYRSPFGPNPVTPSHPTVVFGSATWEHRTAPFVAFTFENGHQSSPLTILEAETGFFIGTTGTEKVFTKIWSVATIPSAIAFCSITEDGNITASVRTIVNASTERCSEVLQTLWSTPALPYSPPGLWDNPNLDVDSVGKTIFLYEKEAIGQRSVKQFSSRDGKLLWSLNTTGHIVDYDTYAYDGYFFRLVTDQTTGNLTVQMYLAAPYDGMGTAAVSVVPTWSTTFPCNDPNGILLVGGNIGQHGATVPPKLVPPNHPPTTRVFVLGLNTGTLWAFDGATGTEKGEMSGLLNISTAVVAPVGDSVLVGIGGNRTFAFIRFH